MNDIAQSIFCWSEAKCEGQSQRYVLHELRKALLCVLLPEKSGGVAGLIFDKVVRWGGGEGEVGVVWCGSGVLGHWERLWRVV